MTILTFLLISYLLLCVGLYFIFQKTNVPTWKAWVPGLNFVEWCTLIGRPKWWAALLLIPIVNIFIFVGMSIDLARSFGKLRFRDTVASTLYAPAMFAYLGLSPNEQYQEPILTAEKEYYNKIQTATEEGKKLQLEKLKANNPYKKAAWREWVESIFFAVFAAAFIRMFIIEAFVIPTPSMENSLNVGDYLFVSKVHYGIRTPMTIAMLPLVHNRVPLIGGESYFKKPSLPYYRTKGLTEIKRNDPFVFNWPVGDSIYLTPRRSYSAAQIKQVPGLQNEIRNSKLITRPIDKKDHYVKRCVGMPGDSLEIKNRDLYINGTPALAPENMQFQYNVTFPNKQINRAKMEEWGIGNEDAAGDDFGRFSGYHLTKKQAEKLRSLDPDIKVVPAGHPARPLVIYPNHPTIHKDWSVDNFGPIWIPKKGETIQLTPENVALYERIMNVYDQNDSYKNENGKIFINGEPVTTYTFKQDYYWAMGDNRHNSEDSRMWGFVPEDHVVGKPLFIWFSTKNGSIRNGINWDRIFTSADIK